MIKKIARKTGSFFRQCIRVWHLLRKPGKQEFTVTAKVSGIGILIIGFIGFLISLFMDFF